MEYEVGMVAMNWFVKNLETRKVWVTLFIFWSFFTERCWKCEFIAKQEATLAAPLEQSKLKGVGVFCRKFSYSLTISRYIVPRL